MPVTRDDVPTARREASAFLAALLGYGVFYAAFFIQSFLSGNYIAPSDSLDFGAGHGVCPDLHHVVVGVLLRTPARSGISSSGTGV